MQNSSVPQNLTRQRLQQVQVQQQQVQPQPPPRHPQQLQQIQQQPQFPLQHHQQPQPQQELRRGSVEEDQRDNENRLQNLVLQNPNNVNNNLEAVPGENGVLINQPQSQATNNWQSSRKSVKDRISFLFNNETLCDIYFILGKGTSEQQRTPAHKFVLAIGSVVFDAMFNGGFSSGPCNEIEIPDIEPASFMSMLKYLYTDEVSIGPDTVMSTLYAAKKYTVPNLEKLCVDFLKSNLGPDNAFTLLSQARLFDEPQLAELCLTCIDKNTVDSFNAEGFTDIDLETLRAVLERDSLNARESQLFEAVVRWADHECRRKDISNTVQNKRYLCIQFLFVAGCQLLYLFFTYKTETNLAKKGNLKVSSF